jgi:hypothetical protein
MFSRIAAATLFLSFVAFVNLAATITASFNRVETSVIASIAGIFQVFVDVGAIIIIAVIGMRLLVKLAEQTQMTPRPVRVQQADYRPTAQPAQRENPTSWNPATPQPLPFDNHGATEYTYTAQAIQQPITQNGRETKIHQMRTRDGYKMVR